MRKLDIGSLPDRIAVKQISGDRVRIILRTVTGEKIGADLSAAQLDALLSQIGALKAQA